MYDMIIARHHGELDEFIVSVTFGTPLLNSHSIGLEFFTVRLSTATALLLLRCNFGWT
jgi:hypothetical protein